MVRSVLFRFYGQATAPIVEPCLVLPERKGDNSASVGVPAVKASTTALKDVSENIGKKLTKLSATVFTPAKQKMLQLTNTIKVDMDLCLL